MSKTEAADDLVPATFDQLTGAVPDPEQDLSAPIGAKKFSSTIEFDAEDLVYPRLRLAQGLTPEVQEGNAKPGQWVMSGFPAMDRVTAIPILIARTRALVVGQGDTRQTVCSSDDCVTGVGTPGGECAKCPMAQWTPNADVPGKNRPPKCDLKYSYVCWGPQLGTLFEVEFKKTGSGTAKLINSLISSRGFGYFAIELFGTSQKGPQGLYSVPNARIIEVADSDLQAARLMSPDTNSQEDSEVEFSQSA